jgi:hypothetical protein
VAYDPDVPFRFHRAVGVAVTCTFAGAGVAALSNGIDGGAVVSEAAVRGDAFQVTDTLAPPLGCERVVVIGDSLMDNSGPWLRSELASAGYDYHVDAQPSRRIPERVRAPYSGVRAARAVRSTFGEADCWMVALGSNDLIYGGGVVDEANGMLDEMLAAVTPGASVWWVNVNYHRDPRTNYDFVRATAIFNRVVADRAAADPNLRVIDWYTLSEANLQWFFDPVHVDRTGSIVRAEYTVAALPPPRR